MRSPFGFGNAVGARRELTLPLGEMFSLEAACVDQAGQAQLWLSVNGEVTLQATP